MAKQAAVVAHRARTCIGRPERGPEQRMVRCHHGTPKILLNRRDRTYRAEPVPADHNRVGIAGGYIVAA